ncbi:histidine phosphatase family protein [Nocardioides humi]|uniref:Histidine phosphatase family protein n=1 Tax=Nocardioides humi TaxID=449461 RepID=A0ABN2AN20_9ACTN|nr:histidine phosphatase family protein [Nocardioides humi]
MRLLLVRHGQTPHNVNGALDTAYPGAGLTPLGRSQAAAVPHALREERVTAVYASPLVRTQLTATPLATARGLDVVVRDGLEEISAGDLELRRDPDAVRAYVGCLSAWIQGDLDATMPGGPTGGDFWTRYNAAIGAIASRHDEETVAVFSHGAAIRVFTTMAARLPQEVAVELGIMNTGMAVLEGDPDAGWDLATWHAEPLGGLALEDAAAEDVTGEEISEVDEAARR